MDRQQLILAIAATLLGTFLAGWFAGWLVRRVAGTGRPRQAAMEAARIGHQDAEAMLAAGRDDLARARAALTAAQAEIDELRNHVDRELAHGGEPADRNSRTDQRKEHLHDGESDRREGAGRRTA